MVRGAYLVLYRGVLVVRHVTRLGALKTIERLAAKGWDRDLLGLAEEIR